MARILSVAYDVSLLNTRELILQNVAQDDVVSASSFIEAMEQCCSGTKFDLLMLGHSIPFYDKRALISVFRAHCPAPILALKRPGEEPVGDADFEIEAEPHAFVQLVKNLLSGKAKAAD